MRPLLVSILLWALSASFGASALAQEEFVLWHAMDGTRGRELETLVQRYNASQTQVRVKVAYKGSYEKTMNDALAAQRAGQGPTVVQVYDLGTANMMYATHAVRPLWQVFQEAGEKIDAKAFLPAVAGYFADQYGNLQALPFNVSTPILFYNKDAFRKAKLDPDNPPKTWYEMPKAMGALLEAGFECAYTTAWPAWIQVENMSTWHGADVATKDNGLAGLDTSLIFNTHLMVRHISMLASWARAGYFTYSGRGAGGERRFASGECAMVTSSSASYAELRSQSKFDFGTAQLPYYDDIKGAPHHSLIGGGGLWVLAGRKPAEYRAAARFLSWLVRPEVQADWSQVTGYVPLTRAAYDLGEKSGFYKANPGHEIAVKQLLLNAPTRESRGIRLGDFPEIRAILEQELEEAWADKVPPKVALDRAAERGNQVLRKFESQHRSRK
ncbi:MAG TPA: sn-glycerol-3-phosphate ABC transporter substrate-binding protein UgpB [Burkholderiales bacterium]|nr:sn-glycerol-3-phosphate ABC transporter substrate-binding protein UgpB [Burkholderiales bacterium]